MRLFILILILLLLGTFVSAQDSNPDQTKKDTLREVNGLWSIRALKEVTKDYPDAYKKINTAGWYNGIGTGFAYTGGFILAYQLTDAFVYGHKPSWAWCGAGLGFVALSAPFYKMCNNHIYDGIDLYYLEKEKKENSAHLDLGFNPGGFGLRLSF
ncbi:MAG: hypothetical protein JXR53_12860 [Bacteroidales bacterium]|nr:hypothetical protein [Bacteroidales bacterium]